MQAIKALVIGLGVLIVIALTILVVTVINRLGGDGTDTPDAPASAMHELPAGATLEAVHATDDRLTLQVRLADGATRFLFVDPAGNRVTGVMETRPAVTVPAPPAASGP